jgi:hypothetical protein
LMNLSVLRTMKKWATHQKLFDEISCYSIKPIRKLIF